MKWYYLLSSLPPLSPSFGAEPPIRISALWKKIQEEGGKLQQLVQVILLRQDVENLECLFRDNSPTIPGCIDLDILTKVKDDSRTRDRYFPSEIADYLSSETWNEGIWKEYFQYLQNITQEHSSDCLQQWIDWELGLRKYIAEQRAVNKGISAKETLAKLPELHESYSEHTRIWESYRKASDPWQAEQILDQARWNFVSSIAGHYTFEDSEILGYVLQLLILERWWRISQTQEDIFEKVING